MATHDPRVRDALSQTIDKLVSDVLAKRAELVETLAAFVVSRTDVKPTDLCLYETTDAATGTTRWWFDVKPELKDLTPPAVDEPSAPPDGLAVIAAERRRQIAEKGYGAANDDSYVKDELVRAALSYAEWTLKSHPSVLPWIWPWSASAWRPEGRVTNLAKAGALIAAEIDRVLRELARQR